MTRQGLLKQIQRKNEPLKRIAELEQENTELKEQNANLIAMLKSEREVRVNDDYLKGICERDAEIDELKEQLECAEHNCKVKQEFNDNQFKAIMDFKKQANEIIKGLLGLKSSISSAKEAESRFNIREKAEAFLKEMKE